MAIERPTKKTKANRHDSGFDSDSFDDIPLALFAQRFLNIDHESFQIESITPSPGANTSNDSKSSATQHNANNCPIAMLPNEIKLMIFYLCTAFRPTDPYSETLESARTILALAATCKEYRAIYDVHKQRLLDTCFMESFGPDFLLVCAMQRMVYFEKESNRKTYRISKRTVRKIGREIMHRRDYRGVTAERDTFEKARTFLVEFRAIVEEEDDTAETRQLRGELFYLMNSLVSGSLGNGTMGSYPFYQDLLRFFFADAEEAWTPEGTWRTMMVGDYIPIAVVETIGEIIAVLLRDIDEDAEASSSAQLPPSNISFLQGNQFRFRFNYADWGVLERYLKSMPATFVLRLFFQGEKHLNAEDFDELILNFYKYVREGAANPGSLPALRHPYSFENFGGASMDECLGEAAISNEETSEEEGVSSSDESTRPRSRYLEPLRK